MTNQYDPFEVSKAKVSPFRRSIKVVEAASSRSGRTGVIQHSYRPRTWAMEGKRKTVTTDGNREHTVIRYGGGPTPKAEIAAGLTTAGTAGAILHHDRQQKKKNVVSKSDPFEINKKEKGPYRRPTFQNTRRENTKVGATTGAAIYGGAGAAIGATASSSNARRGIRALREVGAGPSKVAARKLIASHATKGALATGAVAGTIGAGLGAAAGAMESPKGSKGGEYVRQRAIDIQERKAAKAKAKVAEFSKSAFGLEPGVKASKKRQTGYGTVGAFAGSQAGKRTGFKLARTSQHEMDAAQRMHGITAAMGGESRLQAMRGMTKIRGTKTALAGDVIGSTAGIAGGVALARRHKKNVVKSAFGVEHEVEKADRRMGGQATWSGHLPEHTPGAVAGYKSAFLSSIEMPGNVRPVKPGLRKIAPKLVKIPK